MLVSCCPRGLSALQSSSKPFLVCPQKPLTHFVCGGKQQDVPEKPVLLSLPPMWPSQESCALLKPQRLIEASLPTCGQQPLVSDTEGLGLVHPLSLMLAFLLCNPITTAFFCFLRTRCRCFPEFSSTSGSKFFLVKSLFSWSL